MDKFGQYISEIEAIPTKPLRQRGLCSNVIRMHALLICIMHAQLVHTACDLLLQHVIRSCVHAGTPPDLDS